MANLFYDHLIDWQKLQAALTEIEIDQAERLEFIEHSEHILHTEILIVIIQHLPPEKHDEFLDLFHSAPYEETHLTFLKTHGHGDVEMAIRQKSDEIIAEILSEIL